MRTSRERASTSFFADWASDNAVAVRSATPRDGAADVPTETAAAPRRGRRRAAGLAVTLLAATAASAVLSGARASADPTADAWHRLRVCESSDNYSTNTGNAHYGAYQFDLATWRSVGGSGYPYLAPPAEQDARALILYRQRGWQPWQCASILGLRPDGSAGSGYTGDIRVTTPRAAAGGIPAFPGGSHWYQYGERSGNIKAFQDRMHARGFFPVGTGEYGPNTRAMVTRLQRLNGLVPNGFIGPNTWRLAWTGKYSPPPSAAPVRARATAVPAFPGGSHWYQYGERSRNIKAFQDRMHARGFFPVGTGEYGPNTLAMVKQLQRLNGLVPNGLIGPNTWRLAWTGTYHRP